MMLKQQTVGKMGNASAPPAPAPTRSSSINGCIMFRSQGSKPVCFHPMIRVCGSQGPALKQDWRGPPLMSIIKPLGKCSLSTPQHTPRELERAGVDNTFLKANQDPLGLHHTPEGKLYFWTQNVPSHRQGRRASPPLSCPHSGIHRLVVGEGGWRVGIGILGIIYYKAIGIWELGVGKEENHSFHQISRSSMMT